LTSLCCRCIASIDFFPNVSYVLLLPTSLCGKRKEKRHGRT
jgi:hypothetical protein